MFIDITPRVSSFSSLVSVRPPLVSSGTPKLHLLVFTVFLIFFFFLLPAAYMNPSHRETKKGLRSLVGVVSQQVFNFRCR